MKRKTTKMQPLPKEYGPELRSPQSCEWMKGDGLAYLKAATQRANAIKDRRQEFDTQERILKNQAEFQGGFTFDLAKRK